MQSQVSFHDALFPEGKSEYAQKWAGSAAGTALFSRQHSAIAPDKYRERFMDFMRCHVFPAIPG